MESVLVIELSPSEALTQWHLLRLLLQTTGRYPLISELDDMWGVLGDKPPDSSRVIEDERIAKILSDSRWMDGNAELETFWAKHRRSPRVSDDLFGWLDVPIDRCGHILGNVLRRFGTAPSVDEVCALHNAGELRTDSDLEYLLLKSEIDRFGPTALSPETTAYLDWLDFNEDSQYVAVLPPTNHSWEAFVYLGWYGAEERPAAMAAALRGWHDRFGAELVCSFGTVLQLRTQRRPRDIDEAFQLAIEQMNFVSDAPALHGVSLRDHARALLALDKWFLWAKP
jgi:Domain of unknown function (DUF4253)